ncbi:MAG: rod shape-determining protein [Holophagales bacterium]|nr:rod shape-determining protein [Holophagales bacterium]
MTDTRIVNVGIDLGTSRSVVSASNGQRHVIESYVGWPVDMVARKVLKKDVLVGEEAVKSRTMLDLHRPLERGLIKEGSEKDLAAVRELLEFLLRLAVPAAPPAKASKVAKDDAGKGKAKAPAKKSVRAVVGVPAEAMRVNKAQLAKALEGSVDGLMIVSEPFAVAYGLDALLNSMIVDIGAGTTDFCLMRGHLPTEDDQRTLTNAGDSIDEYLLKLFSDRHPQAQVSIYMVRGWKEKHGFVGQPQSKVEVTAPVDGRPTQFDITDLLRSACESIVEPITEAMLDLLPRIDPEFQEEVRNNIILSGGTSLLPGLRPALEKALEPLGGGKIKAVKDPVFCGADGGLAIALDAPSSDWDKLA